MYSIYMRNALGDSMRTTTTISITEKQKAAIIKKYGSMNRFLKLMIHFNVSKNLLTKREKELLINKPGE